MTPRVAIACSGLGHVARGSETWAATLGEGLHKSGGNVIVFGSGPRPGARSPYVRVPCLRRDSWLRRFMSWDKAYLWEQVTFARALRRHLRADRFDIVHTGDPNLAQQLIGHCRKQGLELIYLDSLLIGPGWCSKFENVHVLAPHYKESARAQNTRTENWRVIPHFIDTAAFAPVDDKRNARAKLFGEAISPAARVALAVGDFSEAGGKRLDWIISEASRAKSPFHVVFVGNASDADLRKLREIADKHLRGRAHFLTGLPYREMPAVYRAADFLVHAALREPFGLVLIEAMASGLPVLGHSFETTKWIVGDGGEILDMTKPEELASALDRMNDDHARREGLAAAAVARARKMFDRDAVLPMYHEWYQRLAGRRQRP
jgi:glycosyltransferase involved in cell wall biosynthesis